MKLPNGERAQLADKLEKYVLNPHHRQGKHKARVFESVLGITLKNQNVLGNALLFAAANSDQAESRGDNGFGACYVLKFPISTAKGAAEVLSAWIVQRGETFPRLTTCYIL